MARLPRPVAGGYKAVCLSTRINFRLSLAVFCAVRRRYVRQTFPHGVFPQGRSNASDKYSTGSSLFLIFGKLL